jgi:hypothetical protein
MANSLHTGNFRLPRPIIPHGKRWDKIAHKRTYVKNYDCDCCDYTDVNVVQNPEFTQNIDHWTSFNFIHTANDYFPGSAALLLEPTGRISQKIGNAGDSFRIVVEYYNSSFCGDYTDNIVPGAPTGLIMNGLYIIPFKYTGIESTSGTLHSCTFVPDSPPEFPQGISEYTIEEEVITRDGWITFAFLDTESNIGLIPYRYITSVNAYKKVCQ